MKNTASAAKTSKLQNPHLLLFVLTLAVTGCGDKTVNPTPVNPAQPVNVSVQYPAAPATTTTSPTVLKANKSTTDSVVTSSTAATKPASTSVVSTKPTSPTSPTAVLPGGRGRGWPSTIINIVNNGLINVSTYFGGRREGPPVLITPDTDRGNTPVTVKEPNAITPSAPQPAPVQPVTEKPPVTLTTDKPAGKA